MFFLLVAIGSLSDFYLLANGMLDAGWSVAEIPFQRGYWILDAGKGGLKIKPLTKFQHPASITQCVTVSSYHLFWFWNFSYFLRKRSMRPAVSISFCLPVKNGWHFEQISTRMSALVEPASNALPHAHLMIASAYSG
jgi:hypothetical protein